MSTAIALEGLDLAALLCSRVCHDLISPVGAIANGLEVMEDGKDEETSRIRHGPDQEKRKHGVRQASVLPDRLRRCRFRRGPDRYRRRRKGDARPDGGRENQDRLESAVRAAGQRIGSSCC